MHSSVLQYQPIKKVSPSPAGRLRDGLRMLHCLRSTRLQAHRLIPLLLCAVTATSGLPLAGHSSKFSPHIIAGVVEPAATHHAGASVSDGVPGLLLSLCAPPTTHARACCRCRDFWTRGTKCARYGKERGFGWRRHPCENVIANWTNPGRPISTPLRHCLGAPTVVHGPWVPRGAAQP